MSARGFLRRVRGLERFRAAIVLGSLVLLASDAPAWNVTNLSTRVVRARVTEGDWDATILPGNSAGCPWWNIFCNPGATPTGVVNLKIETLEGDPRDFEVQVHMEADGGGVIREEARPVAWATPPNLYVSGHRSDGTLLEVQPPGVGATSRHVKFLISADCQFCDLSDCHETWMPQANANAFVLNQHLGFRMLQEPTLRGVCYAGDLTQFASAQEWDGQYLLSIAGFTRFFYDGLGNHDLGNNRTRDAVRERKRTTVKTAKGNPHYSWDWHDVHFVQLNLMPSDVVAPQFPQLDPMGALSFLILDLATHVGTSQRPVVLMHHYGFDSFSLGPGPNDEYWWVHPQHLAYWNAIANYNVVAIFTGHSHLPPTTADSRRFIPWDRPIGASGGPDSIPTFVSGAARDEAYLEVELNNANQLSVSIRDRTAITTTRCYTHGTPVWVNKTAPAPGYGWKAAPYLTLGEAVIATSDRFACSLNMVPLLVTPGLYNETIRITQPTRILADGSGTVRIGP